MKTTELNPNLIGRTVAITSRKRSGAADDFTLVGKLVQYTTRGTNVYVLLDGPGFAEDSTVRIAGEDREFSYELFSPVTILDGFEDHVTNMAETAEIRSHVYQMLADYRSEQGLSRKAVAE